MNRADSSAFPNPVCGVESPPGMTLREYLVGQAMAACGQLLVQSFDMYCEDTAKQLVCGNRAEIGATDEELAYTTAAAVGATVGVIFALVDAALIRLEREANDAR